MTRDKAQDYVRNARTNLAIVSVDLLNFQIQTMNQHRQSHMLGLIYAADQILRLMEDIFRYNDECD